MSTRVVVSSQKFFNEYKNEVGFGTNTSDFTFNFTGSVMENVKVVTQIDINWSGSVSASELWSADTVLGIISKNTGSWAVDGFRVGDYCGWLQNGIVTAYITITAMSLDELTIYYTLDSGLISDSNSASMVGLTPLEGLKYKFGLLQTGESFNTISKVSGNDQGYYAGGIGLGSPRSTASVPMTKLGVFDDWITGSSSVKFVSNPAFDIQRFEITHEFMIVPFFLDGQLSNLQNITPPPLLSGNNSLNYAFDSEFRTSLSNSNTAKQIVVDNLLGDVAWFNENFVGFNNDYNILNLFYEEKLTSAPANGILIGSATRITAVVQRLSGPFIGAARFGAYISYLPEQLEYTNTQITNLKDNFIYDNALNYAGLPAVSGQDFITDISGFIVSGFLVITIDLEYNALQKAFLSNKFNNTPIRFMLGIQVGNNFLTSTGSDRVMLLADTELYDQGTDIKDLMHVNKFDIYTHEKQIGVDPGTTDAITWNEDGLVVDFEFDLNLNLDAVQNSLNFVLLAYNNTTERYFELDSYAFSPAVAVVSGGVQQITENTTRGYILESSDQFNEVIINVGTQAAGLQKYEGRFAQKISWQDWLQNLSVDTIFFDSAEPENNLNDKASNYSNLNDYSIRLGIISNVNGTSPLGITGATDYLFISPDIKVFDYDKDGVEPPVWSCVIETFDSTGLVNLGGAILTGQDTIFRATWTNSVAPVTSLTSIYGINRLEETNQPGYAITEMSSLNLPLPAGQQTLDPSVGTLLDMNIVAGTVVMECLIDGNLVISGVNYNLSSRIHDSLSVIVDGKVTETGVLKSTETSVQKIIE